MTTAVQDRAFAQDNKTPLEALKAYMKIPASETADDYLLEKSVQAAMERADKYLGNPFEDSDGNDQAIPSEVELGVLVWASVDAFRQDPGIMSKSGKYSEQYRKPKLTKEQVESAYWHNYKSKAWR